MTGTRAWMWALAVGLACAAQLAGCGGSTPVRDPAQEARVVAEINVFCEHSAAPGASRRSEQQSRAMQVRSAALLRALGEQAAYLPAGRDLNEAHTARRELERHGLPAGPAARRQFEVRFRRLQLRIYEDELALGVTCAGRVAREAHRTAHLLATYAP